MNWQEPFSFIETDTENLASIYDDLQKRSLPFAHNNLYDAQGGNPATSIIYSDRPNFNDEITSMTKSGKLQNGNQLGHQESTHIASKVVAMQFLPMSKDIINSLSALVDPDEYAPSGDTDASTPSETTCATDCDSQENAVEDLGEF